MEYGKSIIAPDLREKTIKRKKTRVISLGELKLGGGHPVAVQSMTTPKTTDVEKVVRQINELENAGCDIVRVAVDRSDTVDALGVIVDRVNVPVIADVHFDYRLALLSMDKEIVGIRINPGNIGARWKIEEVVKKAGDRNIAIRIGVNAGSLEKRLVKKYGHPLPEALVESAMEHIGLMEGLGFKNFKVSLKSSDVLSNYRAYFLLSQKTRAPLHLGVTEAGTKGYGLVKSAVGIGSLLMAGIGDTIRVSLSADPVEEVRAGIYILKSLGLRDNIAEVISCPTCGRANVDVFHLAEEVEKLAFRVKKNIKIAVMGCSVNGPGESREADIGIAGGKKNALVFRHGKPIGKVSVNGILELLQKEIERM